MLTGDGEIHKAVEAMRLGAENFLTKPIELSHLAVSVEKAAQKTALRRENHRLRARRVPNLKRKVAQLLLMFVLIAGAAGAGSALGGGARGRTEAAYVPVPLDPADTVLAREETPFWQVPK